jgi:hypothetical protein
MAHCGYEATAVNDTMNHPLKAFGVFLRGPKTDGPFAPELPINYPVTPSGGDNGCASESAKSSGNAASAAH